MAIDLLVPCTKRKNGFCHSDLAFRTLPPAQVVSLACDWHRRAECVDDRRTAQELYSGVGWASTCAAYAAAKHYGSCNLHILSAGFGLVHAQDRLPTYSATFSPEEDQIAKRILNPGLPVHRHQAWWQAINTIRGMGGTPISTELDPANRCIVAAGIHYIQACAEDLTRFGQERPEGLLIVCVGAAEAALGSDLWQCTLPIGVQIESLLGGPRSTLNQRVVQWLLTEVVPKTGWKRRNLEAYVSETLSSIQSCVQPQRQRISDDEVVVWIRQALRQEPSLTISRLLALLRQSNLACEQNRFSRLAQSARTTSRQEPSQCR